MGIPVNNLVSKFSTLYKNIKELLGTESLIQFDVSEEGILSVYTDDDSYTPDLCPFSVGEDGHLYYQSLED